MTYSFDIDKRKGVIVVRVWDDFNMDEVLEFRSIIKEHPDFSPDLMQLIDLRAVETFSVSGDEIKRMVQDDPFSGDVPRALLASDPLAYGLARMYGSLLVVTDRTGFKIFDSEDEARTYLGMDD